jgi:hypothetical protein
MSELEYIDIEQTDSSTPLIDLESPYAELVEVVLTEDEDNSLIGDKNIQDFDIVLENFSDDSDSLDDCFYVDIDGSSSQGSDISYLGPTNINEEFDIQQLFQEDCELDSKMDLLTAENALSNQGKH